MRYTKSGKKRLYSDIINNNRKQLKLKKVN